MPWAAQKGRKTRSSESGSCRSGSWAGEAAGGAVHQVVLGEALQARPYFIWLHGADALSQLVATF